MGQIKVGPMPHANLFNLFNKFTNWVYYVSKHIMEHTNVNKHIRRRYGQFSFA